MGIAIDCAVGQAEEVGRFYQRLLGYEPIEIGGPGWAQLRDPATNFHLNIQGEPKYVRPVWPENPGEQAKMLHLEVQVADLEASVALAIEAGGVEAPWQPPDRNLERIRIMLDPAGHPFCLFLAGE